MAPKSISPGSATTVADRSVPDVATADRTGALAAHWRGLALAIAAALLVVAVVFYWQAILYTLGAIILLAIVWRRAYPRRHPSRLPDWIGALSLAWIAAKISRRAGTRRGDARSGR